jgi:prohibitin 2
MIPWFQRPTIFNIQTRPKTISSPTGTRDLQTVDITLRVLYKPSAPHLPEIYRTLGENYDARVLPSIVNEVLKSIIAQYDANQLITQREQISRRIARNLEERATDFYILVDDVSITHLTFGREYTKAIEDKQVAQQEAERGRYTVMQAREDKKSAILRAEGEAEAAAVVGKAINENPGFLVLRQLEAANEIANLVARSRNQVYLDADGLLLNILNSSEGLQRMQSQVDQSQVGKSQVHNASNSSA